MSTEEESFHRPFLDMLRPSSLPPAEPPPSTEDEQTTRPYFLTGGRVHEGGGAIETVYTLTEFGQHQRTTLTFERRALADLCQEPQSVAEISALLHMPLGVAAVLARDLTADGFFAASVAVGNPSGDPQLIMKLIHAVHAL